MDYLDPHKKRQHRIRLYVGYALMTIVIAFATVILVYVGSGYYVDRSTGDLIQNGQLFVNSDPDGATILLNGKAEKPKTAGRLVVPSGKYNIEVQLEGYRNWQKEVLLDGGTIQRIDYARLLPNKISPNEVQTFASQPSAVLQSVDRRFIAMTFPDKLTSIYTYDVTTPDQPPTEIPLTAAALGSAPTGGSVSIEDWSDDNKHMLVRYNVPSVVDAYLIVSRDANEAPINLTDTYGFAGAKYSLRDRAYDSYFIYQPDTKVLGTVSLDNKSIVQRVQNVVAYKTFGKDDVLYISSVESTKGKAQARLSTAPDKTYLMRELTVSPSYLLDMAKYGDSLVLAIGSPVENKVTILRNPIGYLKAHSDQQIPLATTILQVPSPSEVSFSTDASAVVARGGQSFASHSFDEDRSAKFELTTPFTSPTVRWIDGKHIGFVGNDQMQMSDYDGGNVQALVPTLPVLGGFFDNNYQNVYGFTLTSNGKLFHITRASLVAKK